MTDKEITIASVVGALESIWSKRVPSATQAIKELAKMEKQLDAAKTYADVMAVLNSAKALKVLLNGIIEVQRAAEWTILVGNRRLGIEIEKVPKASGGNQKSNLPKRVNLKSGRSTLDFPGTTRSRLCKLATISKQKLRGIAEMLWNADKDATTRAVLDEHTFVDVKKKRAMRERAQAKKIVALPKKKYGVILSDYEWKFQAYSERGKISRAAEKHYSTSDLEVLNERPVEKLAAPDCVWFAWVTVPFLPAMIKIMEKRGFEYKSHCMWDKVDRATGYWFINQHEVLLVGTQGKPVAPAPGTQWLSIITEKAREHSRKPEKSYEMIETYYPNTPKIELNCRGEPRPGWDAWGIETTTKAA